MKAGRTLIMLAGLVAVILSAANNVFAGPGAPGIPGPPVFCWGLNSQDRCVLFLGTEQTCMNVSPCLFNFAATDPECSEKRFCTYMNGDGDCVAVVSDDGRECEGMPECDTAPGKYPRAPKEPLCTFASVCDLAEACELNSACLTPSGARGTCQGDTAPCECVPDVQ